MEETTTTSSILLMAKIGAMVGLGFGSLTLGMLPLIVGRCRTRFRQKRCHGISSNSSNSTSTSTSASQASSSIIDNTANSQVRFLRTLRILSKNLAKLSDGSMPQRKIKCVVFNNDVLPTSKDRCFCKRKSKVSVKNKEKKKKAYRFEIEKITTMVVYFFKLG